MEAEGDEPKCRAGQDHAFYDEADAQDASTNQEAHAGPVVQLDGFAVFVFSRVINGFYSASSLMCHSACSV